MAVFSIGFAKGKNRTKVLFPFTKLFLATIFFYSSDISNSEALIKRGGSHDEFSFNIDFG
jgi:hypothetical protein